MKSKILICLIFTIALIFSCDEEPEENRIALKWEVSEFTEYGASLHSFAVGDDNKLYFAGFYGDQFGMHSSVNGQWVTMAKLEWASFSVQDFTVFKENVYFVSGGALWKADGESVQKINYGNLITGVQQFKSKLFVTGDLGDATNNQYGFAYSNSGSTFTPITPAEGNLIVPGYFMTKNTNKLFIGSGDFHSYEYDGRDLKKMEYNQVFSTVDDQGSLYIINQVSSGTQVVKRKDGSIIKLGSVFTDEIRINSILIKDNIIIALGDNTLTGLSVTFFFDKGDWKPVSTTNYFPGAFDFNGRIMAYTFDGIIAELVYEK